MHLSYLSQSRIYGEDIAKSFYDVKSVSTWIADLITPLIGHATQEEMVSEIKRNISIVYSISSGMDLILSENLPKL